LTTTLASIDLGDTCAVELKLTDPKTDRLIDGTLAVVASGPGGASVTATVTRSSVGTYEALFDPTVAGDWLITATVSGSKNAKEYGIVKVRAVPTVP
jgi:hypothetical protein